MNDAMYPKQTPTITFTQGIASLGVKESRTCNNLYTAKEQIKNVMKSLIYC